MGGLCDTNRVWFGGVLHPRRHVGGVAERGVFAVQVGTDVTNDDEAGVDADPHREVDPVLIADLGCQCI